jgi:hypothetical protein
MQLSVCLSISVPKDLLWFLDLGSSPKVTVEWLAFFIRIEEVTDPDLVRKLAIQTGFSLFLQSFLAVDRLAP